MLTMSAAVVEMKQNLLAKRPQSSVACVKVEGRSGANPKPSKTVSPICEKLRSRRFSERTDPPLSGVTLTF